MAANEGAGSDSKLFEAFSSLMQVISQGGNGVLSMHGINVEADVMS